MPTDKRARQKEGKALRQAEIQRWERRRRSRRQALTVGGLAAAVLGGGLLFSALSDDNSSESAATTTTASTVPPNTIAGETECPPVHGVDQPVTGFAGPPPDCLDPNKHYEAILDTSAGEIHVDLDTENTPETVNNFVVLARYGYYDDTTIFRTNTGIDIIQGGGTSNASDPGYSIPDEGSGYTYEPGQLVMARTAAPNSAGAQFFLVGGPGASSLDQDGSYVVFGTTDDAGLQVVQDILATNQPLDPSQPDEGAPSPAVTVHTVRIRETPAG